MSNFNVEKYLNSLSSKVSVINLDGKSLNAIPDLSRFYQLEILKCANNYLTELPFSSLPRSLKELHCNHNLLTSLPEFNPQLEMVDCSDNQLSQLPEFNERLQEIQCNSNLLTSLPAFNKELKSLSCANNRLTQLPQLNTDFNYLWCSENFLTALPDLNNSKIYVLYCDYNPIYEVLDHVMRRDDDDDEDYQQYNGDIFGNNMLKEGTQHNVQVINSFRKLYYSLKFKNVIHKLVMKVRLPKIQEKYSPENISKLLLRNNITLCDEDDFDHFERLLEEM